MLAALAWAAVRAAVDPQRFTSSDLSMCCLPLQNSQQPANMNREAELASVKQQITKYTNTVAKLGTKLNKAKEKREKYTSNKKKEQKYGRKVQQLQEHLTQQEGLLTSLLIKEDRLEKAGE